MSNYITVRMTRAQALEILAVAGNGYGDGDFYGLNDEMPCRGGKRGGAIYGKACAAIRAGLNAKVRPAPTQSPKEKP